MLFGYTGILELVYQYSTHSGLLEMLVSHLTVLYTGNNVPLLNTSNISGNVGIMTFDYTGILEIIFKYYCLGVRFFKLLFICKLLLLYIL